MCDQTASICLCQYLNIISQIGQSYSVHCLGQTSTPMVFWSVAYLSTVVVYQQPFQTVQTLSSLTYPYSRWHYKWFRHPLCNIKLSLNLAIGSMPTARKFTFCSGTLLKMQAQLASRNSADYVYCCTVKTKSLTNSKWHNHLILHTVISLTSKVHNNLKISWRWEIIMIRQG